MNEVEYSRLEADSAMRSCQAHAAKSGIHEDTELYMIRKEKSGCKEMPCFKDCPLRKDNPNT